MLSSPGAERKNRTGGYEASSSSYSQRAMISMKKVSITQRARLHHTLAEVQVPYKPVPSIHV
jgi:hypothetical protein